MATHSNAITGSRTATGSVITFLYIPGANGTSMIIPKGQGIAALFVSPTFAWIRTDGYPPFVARGWREVPSHCKLRKRFQDAIETALWELDV